MSCDWASASRFTRRLTLPRSTPTTRAGLSMCGVSSATMMPSSSYEESKVVITSAVAIRVFDGTQSVSTDAPPRPSQSTTVTSAPSWAATRAASYPPGPPPMITIRVTYSIVPHARRPSARGRLAPRRAPGAPARPRVTGPGTHEPDGATSRTLDPCRSTPRTPATSTRG